MLLRRIMMIHKYRQILFYSVLVFLFILSCSMRSDPDMEQTVEQRSVTIMDTERTGEQMSGITEDTEETGSGNGGGFHYDGVSDDQNDEDEDDEDNDEDDEDELTQVMLDTRGPSHGFWPDDAQCSRHR